jgi:branched-chain amino acid transport system substrate-binding protein
MRKYRWGVLVAAAATCSLVVASQVSARTDAGAAAAPIKIGISLPITGDFSEPGTAALKGYRVWQTYVNSHGGLLGRKVNLVVKDDQSDQNTIVNDYNALINSNKVDLLLGTFSSLLNLPASAVAEKFHMVYVEPAGGSPKMFNRGFQYLFFAQQATATHQGDLFSKWVKQYAGGQVKTAAYPEQDDPFAAPVAEGIRARLEAAGIKTVYQETYAPTTTDFDTIASAIKSSGADVVVQGAVFDDGVGLIRSMKKVGYSPKALFQTSAPSEAKTFSDAIGLANTQGIFYAVSWSPVAKGPRYPLNQDFLRLYQKKYGKKAIPAEDAADAFAAAQVLMTAVKKVGKIDQDAIRDWLHAHPVRTILGPLSWDSTGAPRQAFFLAQWQGGVSHIVAPKNIADTKKVVFPKPNWK